MDPNITLATLRQLIATAQTGSYEDPETLLDELATAADDLDGWLSKQGFLPTAWSWTS